MTDTTKKPMVFLIEQINYSNVGGGQSKTRATLQGVKVRHNVDSSYSQVGHHEIYLEDGNLHADCIAFAATWGLSVKFIMPPCPVCGGEADVHSSKDSLGRYRCMDCKDKPHTARCTTNPMEDDKLWVNSF